MIARVSYLITFEPANIIVLKLDSDEADPAKALASPVRMVFQQRTVGLETSVCENVLTSVMVGLLRRFHSGIMRLRVQLAKDEA